MESYLARVYITLKPTVNDPQGLTIRGALHSLGFAEVQAVRAGKYLEIRVSDVEEESARSRVEEMCRKLLANPVIEDYRFELEAIQAVRASVIGASPQGNATIQVSD